MTDTRREAIERLIEAVKKGGAGHGNDHRAAFGDNKSLALFCRIQDRCIDSALAFHEEKLSGWWWQVGKCSVSDDARVAPDFNCPIHGLRLRSAVPELAYSESVEEHVEWADFTDVDQRPAGNAARALLLSDLIALRALASEEGGAA